jgi:hypothetical protein
MKDNVIIADESEEEYALRQKYLSEEAYSLYKNLQNAWSAVRLPIEKRLVIWSNKATKYVITHKWAKIALLGASFAVLIIASGGLTGLVGVIYNACSSAATLYIGKKILESKKGLFEKVNEFGKRYNEEKKSEKKPQIDKKEEKQKKKLELATKKSSKKKREPIIKKDYKKKYETTKIDHSREKNNTRKPITAFKKYSQSTLYKPAQQTAEKRITSVSKKLNKNVEQEALKYGKNLRSTGMKTEVDSKGLKAPTNTPSKGLSKEKSLKKLNKNVEQKAFKYGKNLRSTGMKTEVDSKGLKAPTNTPRKGLSKEKSL